MPAIRAARNEMVVDRPGLGWKLVRLGRDVLYGYSCHCGRHTNLGDDTICKRDLHLGMKYTEEGNSTPRLVVS